MGYDLLIDELHKLQLEYRNILENALNNIFQKDSDAIIDEINIFWHQNQKMVHYILRYLSKPYREF